MESSSQDRRTSIYKKIVRFMWVMTLLGILAVAGLFIYLSTTDLPSFEQLENPKNNLATEVYAADGTVLGRYFVENRVPVAFDDLSQNVVDALIATEDERYYNHPGIDFQALMRVFFRTVVFQQESAGGGSTITQQLAKLLYTDKRAKNKAERAVQKLKEWITSAKLERSYTKDEIMAMYLNQFNFINGAYGIKAASEIYFGKPQDQLDIPEAATLVGMLKNPSLFNPVRFPDTTKHRRMVVLHQMEKNGFIEDVEYQEYKDLPMDMTNFSRNTHADGLAPYFRMELRKELNRILNRKENHKKDGSKYNIYKDGLKIYTTLDPTIQKHAEAAVWEHMQKLQKKFDKVWKKKDPWTWIDPPEEDEEELTDEEKEILLNIRSNKLEKDMRGSERYVNLRKKHLQPIIDEIRKDIDDYALRDHDIERLLREEDESGTITKLVSEKYISSSKAIKYRKVMRSDNFEQLKNKWNEFQYKVDKEFHEPTDMIVFAYNDRKQKDTTLTPMDSIKYHRMFLQVGSMAVDPKTGYVKSWVGGINHKFFQFDHVTSERQVGSTFKPFIYTTAIVQQDMSPCHVVMDQPYTIHVGEGNFQLLEDWTPANANDKYSGEPFSLVKGLQWSKNTVSVWLMKQLGDSEPVRELVHNMGLNKHAKRDNGTFRVPKQPSLCLGATDLTVMEMTGAYTTFANNGTYNKPIFISKIEDKNGRIVHTEVPDNQQALPPNKNYVMISMLKSVMKQGLPGFNGIKSEVGGKTGTTNDYVDGWFMGLTPDLVVGTWVGGEDQWIRFLSLQDGIGAKMARPIFAKFLSKLEKDEEANYSAKSRFKVPLGDIGIELDCEQYQAMHGANMPGINPFQPQPGTTPGQTPPDEMFGDEDLDEEFGDEDLEEEFGDEDIEEEPIPAPSDGPQPDSPEEEEDEEEDFGQ